MANLDTEDQLALAALVVALAALISTFLQVLQQYFSTAEGYRRCGPSVMGEWARFTQRRFKLREFRFETVFATPVIFLTNPTIAEPADILLHEKPRPDDARSQRDGAGALGALGRAATLSYRTLSQGVRAATGRLTGGARADVTPELHRWLVEQAAAVATEAVENEHASWIHLLDALGAWCETSIRRSQGWGERTRRFYRAHPIHFNHRRSLPAVRASLKSWDFIPADITRPYAATTVRDLVVLAHMLGLVWTEFSPEDGRLQARSELYLITSYQVRALGTVIRFSFSQLGGADARQAALQRAPGFRGTDEAWSLGFGSIPLPFPLALTWEPSYGALWTAPFRTLEDVARSVREMSEKWGPPYAAMPSSDAHRPNHSIATIIVRDVLGMLGGVIPPREQFPFASILNPAEFFGHCHWLRLIDYHETLSELVSDATFESTYSPASRQHLRRILDKSRDLKDEPWDSDHRREILEDGWQLANETIATIQTDEHDGLGDSRARFKILLCHLQAVASESAPYDDALTLAGAQTDDEVAPERRDLMQRYFALGARLDGFAPGRGPGRRALMHALWLAMVFRCLCWHQMHRFEDHISSVPRRYRWDESPIYIE